MAAQRSIRKGIGNSARSKFARRPAVRAVIRNARVEDAAALKKLLLGLGYASSLGQVRRRIAETASASDTAIFVAEGERAVLGIVSIHCLPLLHTEGKLGRITSLVVAPGFRQRGVGKALVAAVEKFARQRGCARLEVTSGDQRSEAHAFYESMGFRRTSQRFIKHGP